jgi:hypothetical protein
MQGPGEHEPHSTTPGRDEIASARERRSRCGRRPGIVDQPSGSTDQKVPTATARTTGVNAPFVHAGLVEAQLVDASPADGRGGWPDRRHVLRATAERRVVAP